MCSHFVVKLHEATRMLDVVDYVREMTKRKSCKYGKYGSFEHLLFCSRLVQGTREILDSLKDIVPVLSLTTLHFSQFYLMSIAISIPHSPIKKQKVAYHSAAAVFLNHTDVGSATVLPNIPEHQPPYISSKAES